MDDFSSRSLSSGRCFVYLLPCREEDTQKIGFTRDPWVRMRALHSRFFEFFDLDRGALIETDQVREARAIETRLKSDFAAQRWLAPLPSKERAGGKTEWFRGIDSQAMIAMRVMSETLGYPLHSPLAPWLRELWMKQAVKIGDWSKHQFELIETLHFNADSSAVHARTAALRNQLAAWEAIGIPLGDLVGERVWSWFVDGFGD